MGRSLTPRQRELFVVFLLALFPAANALPAKMDEDTWWHLAVGRFVVEHRAVPTTDPFSRIGQEEQVPWVAYSWLHEVGLYAVHGAGGLPAILAFRTLLNGLTFLTVAWFVLRGSGGRLRSLLVLGLVTATLVPLSLERPWHYTIICTTLCLHAAIEMRAGAAPRRFWWLVPVFALWANLHIQFVLGFGVLGLGWLTTRVETRRAGKPGPWLAWAGLIAACVLATLANPYHIRLYGVVWEYATQTGALRVVSELVPPSYRDWWNWALGALLVWAGGSCLARRLPVFDTAFLVVGAIFALRMQRDIWFGSLTAAAVLARVSVPALTESGRRPILGLAVVVAAAMLLVRLAWSLGPGAGQTAIAENRKHYPAGAVEYLREHRPPGPLANHFNWGGYLIWTLPEYPVGMDGRTNLYGEERLGRAYRTWNGLDGWDTDPDLLAAGVVVGPKVIDTPFTELLRAAPDRWRVVYEDDVAVVFVPETTDSPRERGTSVP